MRTLLVTLAAGAILAAAPPAHAESGNPAARSSGEIVGGSVEAAATLGSAGIAVTAASVVAVSGSTAAIVTGNPDLANATLDFAGDIASAPFQTGKPLMVDETIVVPAGRPSVPYEAQVGGRQ